MALGFVPSLEQNEEQDVQTPLLRPKYDAPENRKNRKCSIILLVVAIVGVVLAAVGGIMFPVVDLYIKEQVKERVVIAPSSETYEIWQDIPVPVYMQFYLFDIGNPEEVKKGNTPFLKQVGPFTYREYRTKYDIVWNDNGTVTYKQNRTFFFVPDMSVSNDDTEITTINPLIATVAQNFQWMNGVVKTAVSFALSLVNEDIIMTRPVRELLWGYEDQALALMNKVNPVAFPTVNIGYFIRKNYTDDGIYTVDTGETDYHKLGFITDYNGEDHLDIWTNTWANMVNGTDGTLGPPFRFDAQVSPIFVSDICRSIKGIYKKDVETPQGIELRRFGGDRRDMLNATENPDNIGFCTPQTNCLPTGLLNSTLCQEPVNGLPLPVVFSFPHFLYADPSVQSSVVGLNPVEEEHQTVIDQEPWTGLVLQVAKRLQINMYVKHVPNIGQTHNIQPLFFPILWINESSVVDDHWANKLKDDLFTPMHLAKIGKFSLIALGASLFLVSAFVLLARRFSTAK
ncbi:scavenger receptor class B member 1, partial [Elysia marginata]